MINDDTIIHLEANKSQGNTNNKSKLVFFDALNYINVQMSARVSCKENNNSFYNANLNLKKSFNETYENNISEYSITQANFSTEDHVR